MRTQSSHNGVAMKAEWIYYPGDFEVRTVNAFNARRYERDAVIPPIWQSHAVAPDVKFGREFTLEKGEWIEIHSDGIFNIEVDTPDNFVKDFKRMIYLEAGRHSLTIHVFCHDGRIPCVFVNGETIKSNGDWYCSVLDGEFVHVGYGGFYDRDRSPNQFSLAYKEKVYVSKELKNGYTLYDFGEETFGYLKFSAYNGIGGLEIFYGESKEEAEDFACCELTDKVCFAEGETRTKLTKAFRYVAIRNQAGARYDNVCCIHEYNPQEKQGTFTCDDALVNNIWKIAIHTFGLNTREFFVDGIKRDRWVWSGDATQSYLMNKYSFFDLATERRTIVALAGKGEMKRHINTIVDYTLYWLISFYDYYAYTKDKAFITLWEKRFGEILEFCLSRVDESGFMRSDPLEWTFIDWNDALTKDSQYYSFIQILLYKALCSAERIYAVLNQTEKSAHYKAQANALLKRIQETFYDKEKGAFTHSLVEGKSDGRIFRQSNIMAVLYGVADEKQRASILQNVLLNDAIPATTTSYMLFYEYSALCELGAVDVVLPLMKKYYGGMIELGATSFWEYYDPKQSGAEHYAMYGRKYGKSLCHAWGATAIWIIGKYVVGLSPLEEGYDKILLRPRLDLLSSFEATLPLKDGRVYLRWQDGTLCVQSSQEGVLQLGEKRIEIEKDKMITV